MVAANSAEPHWLLSPASTDGSHSDREVLASFCLLNWGFTTSTWSLQTPADKIQFSNLHFKKYLNLTLDQFSALMAVPESWSLNSSQTGSDGWSVNRTRSLQGLKISQSTLLGSKVHLKTWSLFIWFYAIARGPRDTSENQATDFTSDFREVCFWRRHCVHICRVTVLADKKYHKLRYSDFFTADSCYWKPAFLICIDLWPVFRKSRVGKYELFKFLDTLQRKQGQKVFLHVHLITSMEYVVRI